MRNKFAEVVYEIGKVDQSVCIIVADISPAGSMLKFREEFPERFINTGVAEQIMIGMAAGMAQRGLRTFAYTIATFALYRPFEMVRDDLCYQNLPVTVVGIGGGLAYSTLGATHHAQEDVALAMSVPNFRVIAPCDPAETEAATRWCASQTEGPVYLRLGKAGEPDLTSAAVDPWRFGVIRRLRTGRDVCILTYGPIAKLAFQLADRYAESGTSAAIISVSTLKPLDRDGIAKVLRDYGQVVIIEECVSRALAVEVKALAFDMQANCSIASFALKDEFSHVYGTHDDILASHGLSLAAISVSLGLG